MFGRRCRRQAAGFERDPETLPLDHRVVQHGLPLESSTVVGDDLLPEAVVFQVLVDLSLSLLKARVAGDKLLVDRTARCLIQSLNAVERLLRRRKFRLLRVQHLTGPGPVVSGRPGRNR